MVLEYPTRNRPVMFRIVLKSNGKSKIRIIAEDPDRANTKYLDRYNTLEGTKPYIIRMPQSPETTKITIDVIQGSGFSLISKEVMRLETKMSSFDFAKPLISQFIIFSQEFSNKAGWISTGDYLSKKGNYHIQYVPYIMIDGVEANTPARIDPSTGLVQVSQKAFIKYTVPARFAILLHEFCHVFAESDLWGKIKIKDDIEADFHAAQIYLALGYPRIEILNVFSHVFYGAPDMSELNKLRLEKLYQYVMSFDDRVISVKYV